MLNRYTLATLMLFFLTGCDQVKERMGLPDPAKQAAEGNAIGSACRHAGRGLEDCYQLNPTADKASVYAGWKEMNEYMLKNNMQAVAPEIPVEVPGSHKPKKKLKDKVIDEDLLRENLARDQKETADDKLQAEDKHASESKKTEAGKSEADKSKTSTKKTEPAKPAASH